MPPPGHRMIGETEFCKVLRLIRYRGVSSLDLPGRDPGSQRDSESVSPRNTFRSERLELCFMSFIVLDADHWLNDFATQMRHSNAESHFAFRLLLVEENLRHAGYRVLGNLPNDTIGTQSGTFDESMIGQLTANPQFQISASSCDL